MINDIKPFKDMWEAEQGKARMFTLPEGIHVTPAQAASHISHEAGRLGAEYIYKVLTEKLNFAQRKYDYEIAGFVEGVKETSQEIKDLKDEYEEALVMLQDLVAENDHMSNCSYSEVVGKECYVCDCMDRGYYNIPAIRKRARTYLMEQGIIND